MEENDVSSDVRSNLNNDWELNKNITVFGRIVAIEDVFTQKKCIGTGTQFYCLKTYPMDIAVCTSNQCKGIARHLRKLQEDFSFKLIFFDEDSQKKEITCFRKNIGSYINGMNFLII